MGEEGDGEDSVTKHVHLRILGKSKHRSPAILMCACASVCVCVRLCVYVCVYLCVRARVCASSFVALSPS